MMNKKYLITVLSAILAIAVALSSFGTLSFAGRKLGDVNGDGEITPEDARLALRASVRLENLSTEQLLAADVNSDREVTPEDARLILRASVALERLPDIEIGEEPGTDTPATPTEPDTPDKPDTPATPTEPDTPDEPDTPATPTEPDTPDEPDTPATPTEPDTPDKPDTPATPTEPDTPDVPDTPATPTEPGTPDVPDTPATPTEPDTPDVPDTPATPTEPDTPDVPDTPATPTEPDTPDKPDMPATPTEPTETPDEGFIAPEKDNEYDVLRSGTFYFTGETVDSSGRSPMEAARTPNSLYLSMDFRGKQIGILKVGKKTYLVEPNEKVRLDAGLLGEIDAIKNMSTNAFDFSGFPPLEYANRSERQKDDPACVKYVFESSLGAINVTMRGKHLVSLESARDGNVFRIDFTSVTGKVPSERKETKNLQPVTALKFVTYL